MSNQTSEGFAYIERQYRDVKGRIELQRRVVEQLHLIEADASQAEASLNALMDDEASKLGLLAEVARSQSRRNPRLHRAAVLGRFLGAPF